MRSPAPLVPLAVLNGYGSVGTDASGMGLLSIASYVPPLEGWVGAGPAGPTCTAWPWHETSPTARQTPASSRHRVHRFA